MPARDLRLGQVSSRQRARSQRRPVQATVNGTAAHRGRQARGAVHRRRVLPLLRRGTLVDGQRAQPVRHLHRADHHALVSREWRRPAGLPEHARPARSSKPTYTSNYLTFTSVEETTNIPDREQRLYTTLQTPTAAQQALARSTTTSPTRRSRPARSRSSTSATSTQIGNLSPLNPSVLAGKTWAQVAAAMNNPSSALGQAMIGNANYITAAICKLTGNQPASACTRAIQTLEKQHRQDADRQHWRQPAMASSKAAHRNRPAPGKSGRPAASRSPNSSSRTGGGFLRSAGPLPARRPSRDGG